MIRKELADEAKQRKEERKQNKDTVRGFSAWFRMEGEFGGLFKGESFPGAPLLLKCVWG